VGIVRNRRRLRLAVLVAFFVLGPALRAEPAEVQGSVMTMNMYVGADVTSLSSASTLSALEQAVDAGYAQVLASNPRARVEKLAEEIVARGPLLVGLQEAFLIRTGKSTSPPTPATQVQVDYLGMLLEDLQNLGQPYVAVATLPGIDAQAPGTNGQDVRVTDQTVIIAAQTSELTITHEHVENFLINLRVPIPALGTTLTDLKGWASVDAEIDGGTFRFVTTHLENLVPGLPFGGAAIQLAQAAELVEVAAAPDRPLIMAADFNANASSASDPSNLTYKLLVQGGTNGKFTDAWKQLHPTDPGFTCCQAANLQNPVSQLSQRIDLVLYRGPIQAVEASLAGNLPADRTQTTPPLWPSDHAALEATLASKSGN
jgi:endonuclease/exonuclease/phosphatase family metal-dependent hydrolase